MRIRIQHLYIIAAVFAVAGAIDLWSVLGGKIPVAQAAWIITAAAAVGALAAIILIRAYRKNQADSIAAIRETCERIAAGDTQARTRPLDDAELDRLSLSVENLAKIMGERLEETLLREREVSNSLNSISDAVIIVSADKRLLLNNTATYKVFGIEEQDYSGKPLIEILRNKTVNDLVDKALKSGAAQEAEIETHALSRTAINLRVFPYDDERSGARHAVITVRDISRLKRLETVRAEFIDNASHELRTPVTIIRGFVETLLGGAADDPAARKRFLDLLYKESVRLTRLTEDILVLEKSERTEKFPDAEEINIAKEIAEYVHAFSPLADEKGLRLEAELPDESAVVRMSLEDFGRIFTNLIDNAIKFTDSGDIVLRMNTQDGRVTISVADTGIGIPPGHIRRIFERFYRVDKSRSRETGGTGLGLSIVKHLVEKWGGSISVESTPGAGSRFDVSFDTIIPNK